MGDRRIPALDGVRGLAVAVVVLFHVGLARGGWVGVDVFFVLSGFLITSLLLDERRATGRVSLLRFWQRRGRRLLPDLLLVLLVVVVGWTYLGQPGVSLRGDVLSTAGYVANWHFIHSDQSYFASFDASPLRHAWSLAVEEQFYLVWPLLYLGLARLRRHVAIALVAAAAVASACWMAVVSGGPDGLSRAYYGSDTRAATILVGCLAGLALDGFERSAHRLRMAAQRWSSALVVGGAAALLAVALAVPDDSAWLYRRGGFLAIALAGAAVVVGAAHLRPGAVRRALGARRLVHLGVISYALYLWHWPVVLVVDGLDWPRPLAVAVVIGTSLGLAELTLRLVEQPVRRGRLSRPARANVGILAVVAVVASALTIPSAQAVELPPASSGTIVAAAPATARPASVTTPTTTATTTTTARVEASTAASTGAPTTSPPTPPPSSPTTPPPTPPPTLPPRPLRVQVLGDSVAWVLAVNPAPDVPLAIGGAWHAKCDLIGARIAVGGHTDREDPTCAAWPDDWARALEAPADAVVVVLGLRQLFDPVIAGTSAPVGSPRWDLAYREALRRAVAVIRSRTAAPVLWFDVPCFRWAAEGTGGEEFDPARLQTVNAALRSELATQPGVTFVDYSDLVCHGSEPIGDLRRDGTHPTPGVAQDIWRWLQPMVDQAVLRSQ